MHLKQYGIREHHLETIIDLIIINRDKFCSYLNDVVERPVSPLFTYSCPDEKHIRKILASLDVHNIVRLDMRPEVYTFKVFNTSGISETYELSREDSERKAIWKLLCKLAEKSRKLYK